MAWYYGAINKSGTAELNENKHAEWVYRRGKG